MVRYFRNRVAAFMAVFWLLATLHCDLEAAGLFQDGHADQCCSSSLGCASDGCQVVEGGGYKPSSDALKVSAPDLVSCACLICLAASPVEVPERDLLPEGFVERPREWVPTWQFVQRAAPLSRAPSAILA